MSEPTTAQGLGLRGALKKARTMPDPEVDWSAWIVAIEQEARANADRELRELRAFWDVWENEVGWHDGAQGFSCIRIEDADRLDDLAEKVREVLAERQS